MTDSHSDHPPRLARAIRALAIPIILFWVTAAVVLNVVSPQLEKVTRQNSVSVTPSDAPSVVGMKHMGQTFGESDSDSVMMVLIESEQPLGESAHMYYARLVAELERDRQHVQHVQGYWSDPVTASGVQSNDGKAAYIQVSLVGNQGETAGAASVDAVRGLVEHSEPPTGLKAFVTGQAALVADTDEAGDKSMVKMTVITLTVILIMLFLMYRSVTTTVLTLTVVLLEMVTARGVVALLGNQHLMGLTVFVVSILTALAIAAGTDYFIFLLGRYHEARAAGHDRTAAYFTTIHSVSHVILGSGLTIAGALLCLRFTRLSYFNTLAVPCSIGMAVVLTMALTLGPAVLTVATSAGLLESKRRPTTRGWRRLGTAIVRWPKAILACGLIPVAVGLVFAATYQPAYDARPYIPSSVPSNVGYDAAERHFSSTRLNPDVLMVEADHDLRNPSDMLVLDKVAKAVFKVSGLARVQSITRPTGSPIEHGSIAFQMSTQSAIMRESLQFMKARTADTLSMAENLGSMIDTMERMYAMSTQLASASHDAISATRDMQSTTTQLRDQIADFDDFFRPVRNYFYWEPHCFDIPACWAMRSIFNAIDGVDQISETMNTMVSSMNKVDDLTPKLVNEIPPMIVLTKSMRTTMLTMYATFSQMLEQMDRLTDTGTTMGQIFDAAKNDDLFYLPPEAFNSTDFQKSLKLMVSPDGKSTRMTITHDTQPASGEGIARIPAILEAAKSAVKGTPLANAKFYLGGTAGSYHDIANAAQYDLLIAALSAIVLIFIVMLVLTRALVAALVIVGTVLLSLAASFGLSVLVWQHLVGVPLQWFVVVLAVIVLLAVASDYNLLFISRLKEEAPVGLRTGLIRTFVGSGGVILSAALVFAFTMMSMISSDLLAIGQVGTTMGLGLLFDTFIVRTLITPSIATRLGSWFWWPLRIKPTATEALPER